MWQLKSSRTIFFLLLEVFEPVELIDDGVFRFIYKTRIYSMLLLHPSRNILNDDDENESESESSLVNCFVVVDAVNSE